MPLLPAPTAAGLSGPPPGEIVEGLRNPYLDKFIPPRRREASDAYRAYKPIQPQYLTCGLDHDFSKNSVDTVAAFVETLNGALNAGARCDRSSSACAVRECLLHLRQEHNALIPTPFSGVCCVLCAACSAMPTGARRWRSSKENVVIPHVT